MKRYVAPFLAVLIGIGVFCILVVANPAWLVVFAALTILAAGALAIRGWLAAWRMVFYSSLIAGLGFASGIAVLYARTDVFARDVSGVSAAFGLVASFITVLGWLLALGAFVETRNS